VADFLYLCAKTLDMNLLILGDNLEMLKRVDSESVDLIYLDPPFFSNRNYEVLENYNKCGIVLTENLTLINRQCWLL
jgi:DNA modification methylase